MTAESIAYFPQSFQLFGATAPKHYLSQLQPSQQKIVLVNLGVQAIVLGQWQWIPPITTIIRRRGLSYA
jgi:hypothetical protein